MTITYEETAQSRRRRAWVVALAAFVITVASIGAAAIIANRDDPGSIAPAGEPGSVVTYGASQGIGDGCATAFAVGQDGLWTAGPCGLMRFDGATWWLEADLPEAYSLTAGADGGVWVGTTGGGVIHFDGTTVTQHDVHSCGGRRRR